MIFHAVPDLLPGGYAGVDIFFVISGYLISGLILNELDRGTFSFRKFYLRRIKRILPAFIALCLFASAMSLYLLDANDLIFFGASLAACWLFASNLFFSFLSGGYFNPRFATFPLLHTWSLGVEEQFYFVFPIVLFGLIRYSRRHAFAWTAALGALLILLSQYESSNANAYYLPQYRAHELLIGFLALLAVKDRPLQNRTLANAVSVIGLTLMLGSLFLLNAHSRYPGFNSLFPCLGAALAIYAGTSAFLVRPFLSCRPLVMIGLLSYSLYLWHWPVLVFLRYRGISISGAVLIAAIGVIFFAAYLSWRFIETPARRNDFSITRAATLFYALPACLFISLAVVAYATDGLPQRAPPELRELMASYSTEVNLPRGCSQRLNHPTATDLSVLMDRCSFGDTAQQKAQIFLIGDSHANHLKPFIDVLAKDAHLKAVYQVVGSCLPLEYPTERNLSPYQESCLAHNRSALTFANRFHFMVLAGEWSEAGPMLQESLSATVAAIIESGAVPVVFKDTPKSTVDNSQCVLRKARGWLSEADSCNIALSEVTRIQRASSQAIDQVQQRFPQMMVVDPKTVMCNDSECEARLGNLAVFKDSSHINSKAAEALGALYLTEHPNPFTSQ